MARFSFGGAQDLSSIFADLYRIDLQERLREQAAEDENIINRWETGDMSDEEFYAYAERRIREATDPEVRSQWEIILRNARQGNDQERIADTAEDIMDGIEVGTRSWQDLLKFYKNQKRKLKPSDPLYRQIEQKINEVEDRIRDNEVAGTLGSIEYRFRSGQISAAQAQKEIRALAERYKKNDPQRYYQLLGMGLDFKDAEAAAASGGRRGGGGSGGSGLKETIDQLKGWEDRLLSLSRQGKDGQRVGTITVPTEDGSLTTETVTLLTPDGRPTQELRSIHQQTLQVYNELEAALIADGKAGEAGSVAARRESFITDIVQPANTISKERQWEELVRGFVNAVRNADNAPTPEQAWQEIQQRASAAARWASRLNTTVTSRQVRDVDEERQRENPELGAAAREQTIVEESDRLRRLTPEFIEDVTAQINAVLTALNSSDPQAIMDAFGNLPEGSELAGIAPTLARIQVVRQGLADGSWQYAMTADGPVPVRLLQQSVGIGPDGRPQTIVTGYEGANGETVSFGERGAQPTTVYANIQGSFVPVMGFAQEQRVATQDFTWDGVQYRRGQVIPNDVANAIARAPRGSVEAQQAASSIGGMRIVETDEGLWYGIDLPDGSVGWFENRVPRNPNIAPLAAPYTGSAESAQRFFEQQGLDPTGRAVLDSALGAGKRVSMRAFDRFAGPQANVQRATADTGYRSPQIIDPSKRLGTGTFTAPTGGGRFGASRLPNSPTLSLSDTLAAVRGDTSPIDKIAEIGQSLGIRNRGWASESRFAHMPKVNVAPPKVVRPHIPKINAPTFEQIRARIGPITATAGQSRRTREQLHDIRQRTGGFI